MLVKSCRRRTGSQASFCTKHKHLAIQAQCLFGELNWTNYFNHLILQMGKLRASEEVTCNGHSVYLISILLLQVGKKNGLNKKGKLFGSPN